MNKKTNEILVSNQANWQKKHKAFFINNYKNAPFFHEISPGVFAIFEKKYEKLIDVNMDSIMLLKKFFDIQTEMIMQTSLSYNRSAVKDELVLELCKACKADYHLFGSGAKKYVNQEIFEKNHIKIEFQQYEYPVYPQFNSSIFIKNLSALDMLFNCGIRKSQEIFWNRVKGTDGYSR